MAPLASLAVLALLSAAPPPAALGTFRVRATVRAASLSVLGPVELRGDVVVRPGEAPRALAVRLAARGHACQLAGRAGEAGELTLPPGQRCTVVLDDPGARGRVVATVRSGRGRVDAEGRLTLALELTLAGGVSVPTGLDAIPGLAGEADVPVDGPASLDAEGSRDNSRAAE